MEHFARMEYFASEIFVNELTVEQIAKLGGSFDQPVSTDLEFLVRDRITSWQEDGSPIYETEVLVFESGSVPEEDFDSVDEWGHHAQSQIKLTYSEFQALPLNV